MYGYSILLLRSLLQACLGNCDLLLLCVVVDLLVVCDQLIDSSGSLAGRNVVWCAGVEGPINDQHFILALQIHLSHLPSPLSDLLLIERYEW